MQDNIILQSTSDLYIKNVIYFYNGTIRVSADVLKTEMCFPPPRADYFFSIWHLICIVSSYTILL